MAKKKRAVLSLAERLMAAERTRKWYKENKVRGKKTRQQYYIKNRIKLLKKCKKYTNKNPSMTKKAVAKWQKNNPGKDPKKYRLVGKLRDKCIKIWGNICPICNRKFSKKGYLKRIAHHLQYEPIEYIVLICYQCHNLIHSRKCYGHPFIKLVGEESPECLALSILDLQHKYVELHRFNRICGGSKRKGGKIILVEK